MKRQGRAELGKARQLLVLMLDGDERSARREEWRGSTFYEV